MTVEELIMDLKDYDPKMPVARYPCEGEGSGLRIIESLQEVTEATEPWDRNVMTVVLIE